MMALNAKAQSTLKELSIQPVATEAPAPIKQQAVVVEASEDEEASQKTLPKQLENHLDKFQKTVDIEKDYLRDNESKKKFREQQEHVLQ